MTKNELAWVAGLFEGEGSITINRTKRWTARGEWIGYTLVIQVGMTDKECIETLHGFFGGTFTTGAKAAPGRRQAWVWNVSSAAAGRWLELMLPHFRTQRVREKATVALEFQRQKKMGAASRYDPTYRPRQLEFYERMKALNLRGLPT